MQGSDAGLRSPGRWGEHTLLSSRLISVSTLTTSPHAQHFHRFHTVKNTLARFDLKNLLMAKSRSVKLDFQVVWNASRALYGVVYHHHHRTSSAFTRVELTCGGSLTAVKVNSPQVLGSSGLDERRLNRSSEHGSLRA